MLLRFVSLLCVEVFEKKKKTPEHKIHTCAHTHTHTDNSCSVDKPSSHGSTEAKTPMASVISIELRSLKDSPL